MLRNLITTIPLTIPLNTIPPLRSDRQLDSSHASLAFYHVCTVQCFCFVYKVRTKPKMKASYNWPLISVFFAIAEGKTSLDNCRVMQFQPPTPGRSLAGHVIWSLLVDSGTACEANCFEDDDCMSVNLGPKNQGKHLCELSGSDHNLHPEGLMKRSKFIYKSVWVSNSSAYKIYRVRTLLSSSNSMTFHDFFQFCMTIS